jgi:hypothetical protein
MVTHDLELPALEFWEDTFLLFHTCQSIVFCHVAQDDKQVCI